MWNAEAELENVRADLCSFCLSSRLKGSRYTVATRKARKNGKLIRWNTSLTATRTTL